MVRLPFLLFLLLSLVLSTGCGNVAVFGVISPDMTVIGFVTIVQLQKAEGFSSVTTVTLANNGSAQTLPFCGDQRMLFPMNQFVSARYSPGPTCNKLVTVTRN